MKNLILFAVTLFLTVLVSCAEKIEDNCSSRISLNVVSCGISTKAADNTWAKNDAIGIFLLKASTNNVFEQNNRKYISQGEGSNGVFIASDASQIAYLPFDREAVDVVSYYPYNQHVAEDLHISINTADQRSLPAIDLMTTGMIQDVSTTNPDVVLRFTHRLAKVVVSVEKDATAADIDLSGAILTIRGTHPTAVWSLLENTISYSGVAADITVPMSADGTSAVAIVTPEAAGSGVSFQITTQSGFTFMAPLGVTDPLASGTENKIKIKLYRTEAVLSSTIIPWVDGVDVEISSLTPDVTLPVGAPPIASMNVWKNTNDAASVVYTYNPITLSWSAAPAPFYLEEIKAGDKFRATHSPVAADPITGLKDIMVASPSEISINNTLDLNFKHLMSQITVNLIAGAGFPVAVDLSTAQVDLNNFITDFSLSGISITQGTTRGNYSYTALQKTLLLVPQTIAVNSEFVRITVGGHNYSIKSTESLSFESGKSYVVNLTLLPSEPQMNVHTTDWIEGTAVNHDASLGVAENLSAALPAGKGAFWLATSEHKSGAQTVFTGQYAWDSFKSDAVGDKKFTSVTPLLWDVMANESHTFNALYIPATALAGNNEKEYLGAASGVISFKGLIDFSTNKLSPQTSRLVIKLVDGSGVNTYTATDLNGATLTVKSTQKMTEDTASASLVSSPETRDVIPVKSTTGADGAGVYSRTAILTPQTYEIGATILTIAINGKVYTLPATTTVVLEKGKSYTLTATIQKSAVGLSLSVADWFSDETTNINGDFQYTN